MRIVQIKIDAIRGTNSRGFIFHSIVKHDDNLGIVAVARDVDCGNVWHAAICFGFGGLIVFEGNGGKAVELADVWRFALNDETFCSHLFVYLLDDLLYRLGWQHESG